eukprot:SAG31_NODE_3_length_45830_cov_42.279701_23_plen_380_part_00
MKKLEQQLEEEMANLAKLQEKDSDSDSDSDSDDDDDDLDEEEEESEELEHTVVTAVEKGVQGEQISQQVGSTVEVVEPSAPTEDAAPSTVQPGDADEDDVANVAAVALSTKGDKQKDNAEENQSAADLKKAEELKRAEEQKRAKELKRAEELKRAKAQAKKVAKQKEIAQAQETLVRKQQELKAQREKLAREEELRALEAARAPPPLDFKAGMELFLTESSDPLTSVLLDFCYSQLDDRENFKCVHSTKWCKLHKCTAKDAERVSFKVFQPPMPGPPKFVADLQDDQTWLNKCESNIREVTHVGGTFGGNDPRSKPHRDKDHGNDIFYWMYKAPPMIQNRDFLVNRFRRPLPPEKGKGWEMMMRSTFDSRKEPQKGRTR